MGEMLKGVTLEFNSAPDDIELLQEATADIVRSINECDVKLSDIQLMQSLLLAEEAARSGKDEFRTKENLDDLDKVSVSSGKRIKLAKGKVRSRLRKVTQRAGNKLQQIRKTAAIVDRTNKEFTSLRRSMAKA